MAQEGEEGVRGGRKIKKRGEGRSHGKMHIAQLAAPSPGGIRGQRGAKRDARGGGRQKKVNKTGKKGYGKGSLSGGSQSISCPRGMLTPKKEEDK